MNYIRSEADGQLAFTEITESLMIPSMLYGFHNTSTTTETAFSGRSVFAFRGNVDLPDDERFCGCGGKMHVNNITVDFEYFNRCYQNFQVLIAPRYVMECGVLLCYNIHVAASYTGTERRADHGVYIYLFDLRRGWCDCQSHQQMARR